jgi:hypothetical protein
MPPGGQTPPPDQINRFPEGSSKTKPAVVRSISAAEEMFGLAAFGVLVPVNAGDVVGVRVWESIGGWLGADVGVDGNVAGVDVNRIVQ